MMDNLTDVVDKKAGIVMKQYAAACKIMFNNKAELEGLHQPYLELLRSVYSEDYTYAQMVDASGLIASYTGPAVDQRYPKVSVAIKLFTELQTQIRSIAQSVTELSNPVLQWPAELDPELTGIAPGSLFIGINIPSLDNIAEVRREAFNITEQLYASVQAAIQLLPIVPDYIGEEGVEQSIEEKIPDQAMREILLTAASNLAPTDRWGIDEVFLHGPIDKQVERTGPPKALTPASRKVINDYFEQNQNRNLEEMKTHSRNIESSAKIDTPEMAAAEYDAVKETLVREGSFQGVVRNIALDQRRFELRQVEGIGTIQCQYPPDLDKQALNILNANVMVVGKYEENTSQQPGLVDVTRIEIIQAPE